MSPALHSIPSAFTALPPGPLAFSTVGDAAEGLLPFGWDVAGFQKWTLIYLGVSSLAFVLVWLVGYMRR
ncbi:5'-phosphoribosylglycinamide transformylase [Synechococcus sp. CCY 9618]|uniref:5'-phosphoribosylglycinamide transformylase n=1 Tax=Synechococcus sp. CCY 9618 TaxID=2815602 RepID=UPI001C24A64C|nr:5'-phosphoribosylglycinamide transformylase [Synechococcus sp. CCY 9618]